MTELDQIIAGYDHGTDAFVAPFPCEAGSVMVPDHPRLGIRPDLDRLGHCSASRAAAA